MSFRSVLGTFVLLAAMSWSSPIDAVVYFVSNTADSPVGQPCAGLTGCTLREAVTSVNASASGAEIDIAPGHYVLEHGELVTTQIVHFQGVGSDPVTIDGNDASRILRVENQRVTLRNLTLVRGRHVSTGVASGGAIVVNAPVDIELWSVVVRDSAAIGDLDARGGAIASVGRIVARGSSAFIGNRAESSAGAARGGAVWASRASLGLEDPIAFVGNIARGSSAASGGAMHIEAALGCLYCRLDGNVAEATAGDASGGALYISDGELGFQRGQIGPSNAARGRHAKGGGVYAQRSTVWVERAAIRDNEAVSTVDDGTARGGGVSVLDTGASQWLSLKSVTVSGNVARAIGAGGIARGGGIDAFDFPTPLWIDSVTITANVAEAPAGDATANAAALNPASNTVMKQSIVSANATDGGACLFAATVHSGGYNLTQTGCSPGAAETDVTTDAIVLRAPADNGIVRLAESPRASGDDARTPQGGSGWTAAVVEYSIAHDFIPPGAATCAVFEFFDQRGQSRPWGAGCEPGAFELRHATDLVSSIDDGVDHVHVGDVVTHQVVIRNDGPLAVDDARFVFERDGLTLQSVACAPVPGACQTPPTIAEIVSVAHLPLLEPGDTYAIAVTSRVARIEGDTFAAVDARVPLTIDDLDGTNNRSIDRNTVDPVGDIAVSLSDQATSVSTGGAVTYRISVRNDGQPGVTDGKLWFTAPGTVIEHVQCASTTCVTPPTPAALQDGHAVPPVLSGRSYSIDVTARITATSGSIVASASFAPPIGWVDSNVANNAATDTNEFMSGGIDPLPDGDAPDDATGAIGTPADTPPAATPATTPRTQGTPTTPIPSLSPLALAVTAIALLLLARRRRARDA